MQPVKIVKDKVYPDMYRLAWEDGVLSEDFYNLTWANDILKNYVEYRHNMTFRGKGVGRSNTDHVFYSQDEA